MLDFIGITLLILFFIRGYMKGFIIAVFSVLSIVLGVICALKLSGVFSEWLLEKGWLTSGWVQLISYAVLFVGVILLVRLLASLLKATTRLAMLGWLDGVLGGLLYSFLGLFIWSSLIWLATQMNLIKPDMSAASRTLPYIEPVAPWVVQKAGVILPFAEDLMEDLNNYFEKTDPEASDDVDTDR